MTFVKGASLAWGREKEKTTREQRFMGDLSEKVQVIRVTNLNVSLIENVTHMLGS